MAAAAGSRPPPGFATVNQQNTTSIELVGGSNDGSRVDIPPNSSQVFVPHTVDSNLLELYEESKINPYAFEYLMTKPIEPTMTPGQEYLLQRLSDRLIDAFYTISMTPHEDETLEERLGDLAKQLVDEFDIKIDE